MSTPQNEQGFSLTKLTLLGAIVVPLAIMASVALGDSENAPVRDAGAVEAKLRNALHRLADELRTASASGEDANGNLVLDTGEDHNENGRLDADWSLERDSITFNRLLPDGTFSLPITYRLRDRQLLRVVTLTSSGRTRSTVLASHVARFELEPSGNRITIDLAITLRPGTDDPATQSASVTVRTRG